MSKRTALWLLVVIIMGCHGPVNVSRSSTVDDRLTIKVIGINDFHGNINGASLDWAGQAAGGVDYLASHINQLRQQNPYTVVVSAGDLIGASPLVSGLFHDEPTIEAMNRLGLDMNAVGNHEFDEGSVELLRLQNGGCHPSDTGHSCKGQQVGTPVPFEGAKFRFLAANVLKEDGTDTLFPAYEIRKFNGSKVAFIGMTLEATPSIVSPSGVAGLRFIDEADTVNALVPLLRREGVASIVVLIHEGGATAADINDCPQVSGAIVDIVHRFDDAVDLVVSGHTHNAYICEIANAKGRAVPVTSAGSYGRLFTEIDLTLDTRRHRVSQIVAVNRLVDQASVTPVASLSTLVDKYERLASVEANRIIGAVTSDVSLTVNAAGESALGDLIADSQLAATHAPGKGGAVVAFMNSGGIRVDLRFDPRGGEGEGNVTYGEAYSVQPFGNSLVTMTVTGQQIYDLLESQWGETQPLPRILQVSKGFSYQHHFNLTGRFSSQKGQPWVCDGSVKINGVAVDRRAHYRITVNSFLAEGGGDFTLLASGTDRLGGVQDLDALEAYFAAAGVAVAPPVRDRIQNVVRCE